MTMIDVPRQAARRIEPKMAPPAVEVRGPERIPQVAASMQEPVSLPTARDLAQQVAQQRKHEPHAIRPVVESDLAWILESGFKLFKKRWPRAQVGAMEALLRTAIQRPEFHLVRTDDGAALWHAYRLPWEPELTVADIFVGLMRRDAAQLVALYRSGLNWATSINAVDFRFGSSTGIDLSPIAKRLGCDDIEQSFRRKLRD